MLVKLRRRPFLFTTTIFLTLFLFYTAYAHDVPFGTENVISNTFTGANFVQAADIDGDGVLDVLGAATALNTISWWRNSNGDGSTWTQITIDSAFTAAEEVDAVDVDGDGDLDVVGAAQDALTGEIAWWENTDGHGVTWNKMTLAPLPNASSVHGADLDQDGDIDILGANYTDNDIYWWENSSGDGSTWTPHDVTQSAAGVRYVRAADVDHDGDLDVLAAAVWGDFIAWWENDNNGATWTLHQLNASFNEARAVHVTDLDGDGDMDILGAAQGENRIAWWENVSGDFAIFIEHTVTTNFTGVRSIYTTDLDQDGDEDIVGVAYTANEITWWENSSGDASTWTEHNINNAFGNAISVYIADIDGDGDEDILGAAEADNAISWWENETIHSNALYPQAFTHTITDSLDRSVWSEAADMDRDGDLDVLATGYGDHSISWFENINGDAATWGQHLVTRRNDPPDYAPYMTHSADFDRDGDMDLASLTVTLGDISWYENVDGHATTWVTHTVTYGSFRQFVVSDLDSDGDDDLIGTSSSTNPTLLWWENQNNGSSWTQHTIYAPPYPHLTRGMRAVNAADFDNDGDIDVVAAPEDVGNPVGDYSYVRWWENVDGAGLAWNMHDVDTDFWGPSYLDPADLDQDGDNDILGTAYFSDEVVWWENEDNGTIWTKHPIEESFDQPDTVRAFDIDMDGDLDALVTSLGGDAVDEFAWWENTAGNASIWTKHLLAYADNATSIDAADMDGDGDLDIIGAAWNDNNILWWENRGGQFALDTTATAPVTLNAGSQDDVLQIVATHNGRSGDSDAELTTFELLLEETDGDPLTGAEANAIVANLHIYLDDGSGVFEAGSDTWVTAVNTLSLSSGIQTVPFANDDPNVQLAWGIPRTYFVVIELAADLDTNPDRNGVTTLRFTHITEASSTAQDRDFDIPLTLAYTPNTAASLELRSPTAVSLYNLSTHDSILWPFTLALVFGVLFTAALLTHKGKR